ncbi:MAG: hypothetical protein HDR51_04240 [Treponema sp.]|nr:hypothetical protein [Treponema sp.]
MRREPVEAQKRGGAVWYTTLYWRGENKYNVCATNRVFDNRIDYVVQIFDLDSRISRNFILENDKEVMAMYDILSRMNIATIEEVIKSTKWEFWFRANNGYIYYSANGLY